MKICLTLLLTIVSLFCSGQNDTAIAKIYGTIGEDNIEKLISFNTNEFIGVGNTSFLESSEKNYFLIHLDSNLNVLNLKIIETPFIQEAKDLIIIEQSLYVFGSSNSWGNGEYDAYCTKHSLTDFELIWEKSIGNASWDFGKRIIGKENINLFVQSGDNLMLYRIDTNGIIINDFVLNDNPEVHLNSFTMDSNNILYAAGHMSSLSSIDSDLIFKAFDNSLVELWSSTKQINGIQELSEIKLYDGQIYGVGYSTELSHNNRDHFITSIDINGNFSMAKVPLSYAQNDDESISLEIKNDTISVFGYTKSLGLGQADVQFYQTDLTGNLFDGYNYGWAKNEEAKGFIDYNKGFCLYGNTNSLGNGYTDFVLIKINKNYSKAFLKIENVKLTVDDVLLNAEQKGFLLGEYTPSNYYDLSGKLIFSGLDKDFKKRSLNGIYIKNTLNQEKHIQNSQKLFRFDYY